MEELKIVFPGKNESQYRTEAIMLAQVCNSKIFKILL